MLGRLGAIWGSLRGTSGNLGVRCCLRGPFWKLGAYMHSFSARIVSRDALVRVGASPRNAGSARSSSGRARE
eukprot:2436940-Pyramimonas_sp.AAC.1